jgi:hypothetical protein
MVRGHAPILLADVTLGKFEDIPRDRYELAIRDDY